NLDGKDPHIPLLLWWAVEAHAVAGREQVLEAFATAEAWRSPLVRDVILERLMRRYAAEGGEAGYEAGARLVGGAPAAERGRMLAALEQGLQDRPSGRVKSLGALFGDLAEIEKAPPAPAAREERVPLALRKQLDALWEGDTADATLIRLSMRLGRPAA